ncbi:MAG: ribosome recycling factor [Acidobacteriota bacterium]|nr:ribosome recycling factor [Acidobacteriota bacterium]
MNDVLTETEKRMASTVDVFQQELAKLRTGRASLALVDGIQVDYYGVQTPLNQVATMSVPDPSTITIAPWEPKVLAEVEKAILRSNLGLTPNNDGRVIRLNIPALTEDRRKALVKIAHEVAETSRNAVRQVRREGNDQFKTMEKDKEISEDQMHDGQEQVQKLTDTYIEKINSILKQKETEILEV